MLTCWRSPFLTLEVFFTTAFSNTFSYAGTPKTLSNPYCLAFLLIWSWRIHEYRQWSFNSLTYKDIRAQVVIASTQRIINQVLCQGANSFLQILSSSEQVSSYVKCLQSGLELKQMSAPSEFAGLGASSSWCQYCSGPQWFLDYCKVQNAMSFRRAWQAALAWQFLRQPKQTIKSRKHVTMCRKLYNIPLPWHVNFFFASRSDCAPSPGCRWRGAWW